MSRIQITKKSILQNSFLRADYVNNYSKCKTKRNDIIVNIPCYDCTKPCAENAKVIE